MDFDRALNEIHPAWSQFLAVEAAHLPDSARPDFDAETQAYFTAIRQALTSGAHDALLTLVERWYERDTLGMAGIETSTLPDLLTRLWQYFFAAAQGLPERETAAALTNACLPLCCTTIVHATRREGDTRVARVSDELEQARESLERLDRSKSDFIAIAAHELKTPLTLIDGYAAMLRDLRDEPVADATAQAQLDILLYGIANGTRRLREIVDDMIDVSMIDNNLLSLHFQPVWLKQLLEIILQEFAPVARERRLSLYLEPFPGCEEMFFGDAERLYQALRNLVANAIKYTPDHGQIALRGRKLSGFVEVTIQDTGIGIDPADHARIFEKFSRVGSPALHSTGKTKFKGGGPGLGLPITKGIIEAHGGAIWVESDGHDEINLPGATFHVLIPLRKEPPDERIARLFQVSGLAGEAQRSAAGAAHPTQSGG